MLQYEGSLLNCRKCKNRWILWTIQVNFKKWNQITVEDCLTFPVSLQWFQVLVLCWAATYACHLTHGIHRDNRNTFLAINFLCLIRPEIIIKGLITSRQFWFSLASYVVDQRSGDGQFSGWIKILAIGATSWCSARQSWGTERALCGPQRAGEMSQKKFRRNSRSFSSRPSESWLATKNWLDRGEVHRNR